MRSLVIILVLFFFSAGAQDKIFLKNGTSRTGILVTNAKDFIYFKASDTAKVEKIKKSRLVLMEDYRGNRYLFSEEDNRSDSLGRSPKKEGIPRNIFSIQPVSFLFGRATFIYERLSKDGKIGFVIPLILTFDPSFGNAYNSLFDSTRNSRRVQGVNYITGLDVNFYMGKRDAVKLFVGPRFRYGTDVAFLNIEGYSLQTQFGLRFSRPDKKMVQHLSLGFGFVRILSSPALRSVDPKQSHAWYSINYRLGVKW